MNSAFMESSSRLVRRLLVFGCMVLALGATAVKAAPMKTLVQDVLYRADGTVAQGSVTVRWNGFSTSEGEAVPAGQMTVATDASGRISIPLIANTGSTPTGGYYKVVIKLKDGTTSEEQWVVPQAATTTVAAIRAKVVPQAVAAQFVGRDYVDSAISKVATTNAVHLTGDETVAGVKTFTVSPEVPAPVDAGAAANKGYVDAGLASVGTGSYQENVTNPAMQNLNGVGPFGSNFTAAQEWRHSYNSLAGVNTTSFLNRVNFAMDTFAYSGGFNFNENGYYNKTNWVSLYSHRFAYTPGQHFGIDSGVRCYSTGDCIAGGFNVRHFGGMANNSDEGAEALNMTVGQGYVQYAGTIAAGAGAGSLLVTIAPTQGQQTQGEGRYLIDTAAAKIINAGVITDISGKGPTVVSGSGMSWPVSTKTSLTAAITVASGNTAPGIVTASVASTSGLTTSTIVCVADQGSFETVQPSAVGAGTFTATFRKAHANGAMVAWGGLCGYYLELTADTWTSSAQYGYDRVTAPLRQLWPVIDSTSNTSAEVWIKIGGYYDNYSGSAVASAGSNSYNLYPGAETLGVATSGVVDDTFALAPNAVPWAAGDTVEQPLYPAINATHRVMFTRYFPSQTISGGGATFYYDGLWANNDRLLQVVNNTNLNFYKNHGGNLTPPNGLYALGTLNYGLFFSKHPDGALLYAGCPTAGCTASTENVIQLNNNLGGSDYVRYNPSTGVWTFTGYNNTQTYTFPASGGTLSTTGGTAVLNANNTYTGTNTFNSTVMMGTGTSLNVNGGLNLCSTCSGGGGSVFNMRVLQSGISGSDGAYYLKNAAGTTLLSMYAGSSSAAAPLQTPGVQFAGNGDANYVNLVKGSYSTGAHTITIPDNSGTMVTSDGTGVSGHFAKFDSHGNITDGGTLSAPVTTKVWSAYVSASNQGGGSQYISNMWTGEASTVTRFLLSITNGATCTVQPVFEIYDATASSQLTTVTIPNSTAFVDSGALSIPVVSGHNLRIRVSTNGTCSSYPGAIGVTVEYTS